MRETTSTRCGWFARAYFAEFSFAFIGIGILRFWYQYNLYNLHSTTDYGAGVAWTNILRAAVIGVLLLCAFRGELGVRSRNMLVWGSMVLMTVSSVFNFWELVTGDFSLEVARFVTCGIGLVWGGGMWMDFFSRLRPARALLYLLCGLALSCVLSLLFGYLPEYTMGLVNLFVPALAVLAYWSAMHLLDERGVPGPLGVGNGSGHLATACPPVRYDVDQLPRLRCLTAAYFLFALVLGIALGFPDGVPRALPQGVRSVHQLFVVAVLAFVALYVLARCGRFRFPVVWLFENFLLGLAIVLLIGDGDAPWAHTLATALMLTAESFFYSFTFFTSYDLGRHMRRPPMFMLGVMYGGTLLCMGVGRLLSFYAASMPGGVLAMAVVMSVLVVVELLLGACSTMFDHGLPLFGDVASDARELRDRAVREMPVDAVAPTGEGSVREAVQGEAACAEQGMLTVGAPSFDQVEDALADLRRRCGLTEVEVRIADLIAHGRTRAVIAADLGYSENTIRNYTRSLYQKVGVHSKQELIDLLEPKG